MEICLIKLNILQKPNLERYCSFEHEIWTTCLSMVFCLQYGQVVTLIIPRPAAPGAPPPSGLGKVIVEYPDTDSAAKARMGLHGRRFAGRTVTVIYLNENNYAAGNLD